MRGREGLKAEYIIFIFISSLCITCSCCFPFKVSWFCILLYAWDNNLPCLLMFLECDGIQWLNFSFLIRLPDYMLDSRIFYFSFSLSEIVHDRFQNFIRFSVFYIFD